MENILLFNSKEYKKCKSESEKIDKLGRAILNKTVLYINNEEHRICEVEFYLLNTSHPDPFVHGDPDQKIPLKWYFHKMNGVYKGGTYKGLDMTFGYGDNKAYGGMLIRSIKPKDKNVIEGPCKVVDYILKQNNAPHVADYIGDNGLLNCMTHPTLQIRYMPDHYPDETIFLGPRVGLTLKKKGGDRFGYVMKDYRYLTYPKDIKKYKNTIIANLLHTGKSQEDVITLTKASAGNVGKYKITYDAGKDHKKEEFEGKDFKSDDLLHLYYLTHHA